MDYQMLVRNIFNDMFIFFNGTQPLGLEALKDAYQDEPLFLAFLGDLDQTLDVPVNDVMKECYNFYKTYAGRMLSDEDWEQVVTDIKEYNARWNNPWSMKLILALLELLELEDKDWKNEQQDVGSEEQDELEDGQQEQPLAA